MASTSSNQYSYPKASEMATRSLLSDDKPSEFAGSGSHDHEHEHEHLRDREHEHGHEPEHDHEHAHEKPVLTRKKTDNYEQAAAAAARSGEGQGMSAISGADRPGLQTRQSWQMSDHKRAQHERWLEGQTHDQGYYSTERAE